MSNMTLPFFVRAGWKGHHWHPGDRGPTARAGGLVVAAVILAVLWGWLSSAVNGNAWLGVLVLVGLAVAVVWLVRRLSGPKTPPARELAGCFEVVRAMSGPQFETFVADLFRGWVTGQPCSDVIVIQESGWHESGTFPWASAVGAPTARHATMWPEEGASQGSLEAPLSGIRQHPSQAKT